MPPLEATYPRKGEPFDSGSYFIHGNLLGFGNNWKGGADHDDGGKPKGFLRLLTKKQGNLTNGPRVRKALSHWRKGFYRSPQA